MALSLNSQNNQFLFQFPTDFIPNSIEHKYKDSLIRNHSVYSNILDYINASIMNVDVPSLDFPTVEQTTRYGKKITFRGGTSPYDVLKRDGSIRLKSVDNHFNYFILQDILMHHYINVNQIFVKPFQISILDKNQDELFKYYLKEIVFSSLNGREYGYEKTEFKFDTFDLGFKVNFIDWEYVANKKEPILLKIKL